MVLRKALSLVWRQLIQGIYVHLGDFFCHFKPLWTTSPNFWQPVFGQIFLSQHSHVGCSERYHVTLSLYATISDPMDPLNTKRVRHRNIHKYKDNDSDLVI